MHPRPDSPPRRPGPPAPAAGPAAVRFRLTFGSGDVRPRCTLGPIRLRAARGLQHPPLALGLGLDLDAALLGLSRLQHRRFELALAPNDLGLLNLDLLLAL